MKTKHALAFWCNLKGNYDIVVFDNKKSLNKYAKVYNVIYDEMERGALSFEEFSALSDNLDYTNRDNIAKVICEVYSKDLDDLTTCIDYIQYKIQVDAKLDYGF